MRDIKFRAWDKARQQYQPDNHRIIWMVDGGKLYVLCTQGIWVESDKYVIEQYTGLKDEHGKEIYEGDIVERNDPTKKCRWLEIIWHECGFYYRCSCGRVFTYPAILKDVPTVIGNIRQNPELLEARP